MFGSAKMLGSDNCCRSQKSFCTEFWSGKISGLTFFGYQINVRSHENWSPIRFVPKLFWV